MDIIEKDLKINPFNVDDFDSKSLRVVASLIYSAAKEFYQIFFITTNHLYRMLYTFKMRTKHE